MRCNNCGWDNPNGIQKCEKCNAPLCGSMINYNEQKTPSVSSSAEVLKRTVREVGAVAEPISQLTSNVCPNCGYPLAEGESRCPQCGTEKKVSPFKGTVNTWMQPDNGAFCTLKVIPWEGEGTQHAPMTYSGNKIVLNRQNTDPNNQSITSKEQAVLSFENGDWYIEDHSTQQTTLLRVRGKMKLQSGDVIALGNRLFEFNT